MEILELFIASFIPVLKLLLVTAVGLFLALDRVDILGAEARKHLNNVTFFVFGPSLVASSLGSNITVKSIGMLWFMPLNILFTFIIGSALGWILVKITRAPRELWGLVIGCCAGGNLGYMLLIIVPAVCKERGSPFGDAHVCYNQGMAYSSLSMAIGSVYLWLYVYNIIRLYSSKNCEASRLDNSTEISINPVVGDSNSRTGPLLPLNGFSPKEDSLDQFEQDCPISEGKPQYMQMPILKRMKQCFQTFATKLNLGKVLAPSTIGAVYMYIYMLIYCYVFNNVIIGFTVGVIPQLRKLLVGDTAPLRVVQDTATLLGEASIPTVSLIVGANLLKGIVKAAIHFGIVKNSDKLYLFVLLLQFAVPPAISIGTMSQLHGAGESECSVIMLWTYALASVSLALWSTFFLWFVG
ncbi:hypothetical protein JRO89_XS08G0100200 [Xanthoceras sorbifolium]|uniref:Protein PIN-LIKES 3-like n=1 Tax=Xanthoceras sorbifolium TaxID=99658 RepID=A0ABQ8HP57_9ROSI|nr:hypothetical protein JRO89_XS08G0100200 [Xanthoceras sorbifolium]